MADESTLPDETARHDIEELALKWNGSAMGGLAEQEIRADFETSEVHDRAECREDENDLHNTETPAKETNAAAVECRCRNAASAPSRMRYNVTSGWAKSPPMCGSNAGAAKNIAAKARSCALPKRSRRKRKYVSPKAA